MVLFAMLRKMSHEAVAGVMRTVPPPSREDASPTPRTRPSLEWRWAAPWAWTLLHDIVHTLGEQDVVAVLDAQRPEIVARLCEKMYYADELLDAVDALQGCWGRRDATLSPRWTTWCRTPCSR